MSGITHVPTYRILHRLPGFERHFELGAPYVFSHHDGDCRQWHQDFAERIIAAIGDRQHLPIYRLSHGEFIMALGVRLDASAPLRARLIHARTKLATASGMLPAFYSGSKDNTFETFDRRELRLARSRFVSCLRRIAHEGILAVALNDNPGYRQYIPAFVRWLRENDIPFHPGNYMPFYSIYALLSGSDADRIICGRRLLVITSFPGDKQERVERELMRRGAASVQCYAVSGSKALLDVIDLNRIRGDIDVTLIGAGVGAASVLEQIGPLGSVAIDAGFAIDAIAFPEKRWNRPFCVPDSEFDLTKIRFLEPSDIQMLKALNASRGVHSATLAQLEFLAVQADARPGRRVL